MSASGSLRRLRPERARSVDFAGANSWLLAAIFFCIPLPVAPSYWLSAVMLVFWLVDGRLAEKLRALAAEPLVWIFVGYHAILLASMLWTEDAAWGWRMVRRQNFFLLFPLYLSVARREHFGRYVSAFLLAIALCEVLVLYNWAQLHWLPQWPQGIRVQKDPLDTAPFVDRIMYAPMLAFAGYLALHRLWFDAPTATRRVAYTVLLAATATNLVIAGGRAGLVGFLALLAVFVFQRLANRPVRAAAISTLLAAGVVLAGYHGSDYFATRVDDAIDQAMHYEERPDSSVGSRIVFTRNAWRLFAEDPVLGAGIGDYPREYERINARYTPDWLPAWNPHNQYLYAMTAAGIPGGVMIALVLFVPLLRGAPADRRQGIRRAMPLLLIVICLFESYLMRSNVSLMYVAFTAACWSGVSSNGRCDES